MSATTITVDKPLSILPDIRQPLVIESINDVNEKIDTNKEWTEARINLKDLHQHYLKLCKSRLTCINICHTKMCYIF